MYVISLYLCNSFYKLIYAYKKAFGSAIFRELCLSCGSNTVDSVHKSAMVNGWKMVKERINQTNDSSTLISCRYLCMLYKSQQRENFIYKYVFFMSTKRFFTDTTGQCPTSQSAVSWASRILFWYIVGLLLTHLCL